ncbi:MAG: hypothetical protein AAF360_02145 [Pseudomonadota bacterium]
MTQAISTPQITVNNEVIAIIPNSLKYDGGEGEVNVRSVSSGGNGVSTVHTVDAETMISMVSFDLTLTPERDAQIRGWKRAIGSNAISFSQRLATGLSTSRNFSNMSCTDTIEREAGADGTLTVVFKGDPMAGA